MTSERGTEQLAKYLTEARAIERALTRTLQSHIAMTPAGNYRHGLERHLAETRSHAKRVERRAKEIGHGRTLPQLGADVMASLLAQATALSKLPMDLMRGDGGEEKLLANARDEAAGEALEIALYDTIEALARQLGDDKTAELAASIRGDEERALQELRDAIPELADNLLHARVEGISTYDSSRTGAARDLRRAANSARKAASGAADDVRGAARQARKVPGVARAEGEIKGAVASEQDLAITGYDDLSADEITAKLPELSQIDLGKIDAYERRRQGRKTVLDRIASLRGDEPWPGYDELTVDEVRKALSAADESLVAKVRDYERRHKQRQGVLDAVERELARQQA